MSNVSSKLTSVLSIQDIGSAFSVSFLSIAAGSAFGLWTGVGGTIGILTMAVASVCGLLFGGAPVKASGPTGPTAALMFAAFASLAVVGADPRYISLCLLLAAVLLFVLSFLPIQRLIDQVPYAAMAVFVNGVSLLIITKQLQKVWQFRQLETTVFWWETGIVLVTFVLLSIWPKIIPRLSSIPGFRVVSGVLVAMALGALVVVLFAPDVSTLSIEALNLALLIPDWSFADADLPLFVLGLITLKITAVITFVTLVTAKALYGTPVYARELKNQGLANFVVALFGGIPVTLGFIRTRALQNNGASSVAASALVGFFIIFILLVFNPLLNLIPTSVFIGILLRAGLSSLDLQVWHGLRENPATGILPFMFVMSGAIAIIFYDLVYVLIVSILVWNMTNRIQLIRNRCRDISKCPCLD